MTVCGRMTQRILRVCVCVYVRVPARDGHIKLFNNRWCITGFFFLSLHIISTAKGFISNVREKLAEEKHTVGQSNLHKITFESREQKCS